ncbi:hypothetical protein Tco_0603772 [Tanacetum coccineum]
MLCYLARMEPYYIKFIKNGPFQPKTTEGDAKPESQWTPREEGGPKETWTDLVHSFEGPSDTKENRIMDLKLEYQTFQGLSLVAETFDWDEEEVFDEEEVTQVKVLMALADDELIVGKSHARSGEWVDITIRNVNTLLSMDKDADWQNYLKYINIDLRDELLLLKQAKLDSDTFQIQNTELTNLNHALQE